MAGLPLAKKSSNPSRACNTNRLRVSWRFPRGVVTHYGTSTAPMFFNRNVSVKDW